ncbi:MAG: protoporphyrinogen/coproporphyrinogen oxidase [Leucobacter sp.]
MPTAGLTLTWPRTRMPLDLPDRDSASPCSIAVVGGGIAGLVAARKLALAGARVSLYERELQLGGRVRSVELGGAVVEIGAEAFATRGGAVRTLIEELGLAAEIVYPAELESWVIDGDHPRTIPPGGLLGIPAAPLGSGSLRTLGFFGAVRAALESLLPRVREVDPDTTAADLVRRRLGSRLLERLVRPITLGVYSADPERLPVTAIPGLLAALSQEGSLLRAARRLRSERVAAGGAVAALRDGMGSLVTALTAELVGLGVTIHTDLDIARVTDSKSTGVGACQLYGANDAVHATVDGVVIATPELTAQAQSAGAAVEVIVLVVLDRRLDEAPRGSGALVTSRTSKVRAKALTHVTAKWPDRRVGRAPGEHVVRLSYGRAGREPETTLLNDAEATELARRDASSILGVEISPDSVRASVRHRWAMRAAAELRSVSDPLSGLAYAGEWVHGTGLASVVPGAQQAARELLASINQSTSTPHEGTVRST